MRRRDGPGERAALASDRSSKMGNPYCVTLNSTGRETGQRGAKFLSFLSCRRCFLNRSEPSTSEIGSRDYDIFVSALVQGPIQMQMPLTPTWNDILIRLALTMIAGALLGFNRGGQRTRGGSQDHDPRDARSLGGKSPTG